MADDRTTKADLASLAADTLLNLSIELAKEPLEAARKRLPEGQGHEKFAELVQLEIAGAIAVERVLTRYLGPVKNACEALGDDRRASHIIQAMVNAIVGATLAFCEGMPEAMRRDFVLVTRNCLAEALAARELKQEKAGAARH